VWPYLRFASSDPSLQTLLRGVIRRHSRSVLLDAYANAFMIDVNHGYGPHVDDSTYTTIYAGTVINAMLPGIFERKWEVDSLGNVLRLAAGYFNATEGMDLSPFDDEWVAAVTRILDVFTIQQQDTETEDANGGPDYWFQRTTGQPSDSLEHGRGFPCKYTGMIKTAFRASDDAAIYAFNIPENAFAVMAMRGVVPILQTIGQSALANRASALATEVENGINAWGKMYHPVAKTTVWAYEVDGYGNAVFMDDANIPSLLSLPLFGFTSKSDPLYLATRKAVLSPLNPYFFNGTAAAGVGGPHVGPYAIWPMSLAVQALTAQTQTEVNNLVAVLVQSSACTGLMHESFDRNSFDSYTRQWFAWANSLFGELMITVLEGEGDFQ
jgi:hypothetical protein